MTRWRAAGSCLLIALLATLGVSALDPEWRAAVARSLADGVLADPLKRPELWGVEYGFIGAHLAAGRGFAGPYPEVEAPTAVMPPLLPMIFGAVFALAGYQTVAAFLALLLIRAAVLALGFWCLDRCVAETGADGAHRRPALAGLAGLLILVFAPRQLFFILYDEWFLFGTVAFCLLSSLRLLRGPRIPAWRAAVVWGAALGAMALTQPIIAFALGCAMIAAASRDRLPRLLAALGVAALILVPWAARNTIRFGNPFSIKSTLFFELHYGTLVSPQGIHREEEVMTAGRHPFFSGDERRLAVALGEAAYFAGKREQFLDSLRRSPGLYLAKVAYRIAYVTVLFPSSRVHQEYFNPFVPAAAKYALYPLPFLAAIACWRRRPRRDPEATFLVVTYGAFLLPYVLIHFWLRYWVQILPVLILLVFSALRWSAPETLLARLRALRPRAARSAAAVALLACLAASGAAAVPATAGGAPGPPSTPAPAGGPTGPIGREEIAALAVEIAPLVEAIRGARFKRPVPVEIIDDAGARAHFKERLRTYWPEEQVRAEEVLYAHLGLLPPESDLAAVVFDVLEEQAGGYYDPARDTFFVLGDLPRAAAPIIVAHELTHALDDQAFGIDRMLGAVAADADRAGALEAVVEGSGTVVMTVFIVREVRAGRLDAAALRAFQDTEMGRGERLKAAPLFVQRSVIAPYILGMAFLLRGEMIRMQTGGITPSDIDRAFRDPPVSTEQILHPEKYWDPARRDLPRAVSLPDLSGALGEGWTLAGSGTLGELTVALVTGLDPGDPTSPDQPLERWTNAAATGWDGDRWQIYRNGGRAVSVFASVWDSDRDAREFEAALRLPAGAAVRRRGDAVAVVAGDAGGAAGTLLRKALAAASGS